MSEAHFALFSMGAQHSGLPPYVSIEGQGHIFSRFCMFCALLGQDIR